jgi:hypothetical protein
VTVLEVTPVMDQKLPEQVRKEVDEMTTKIVDAGDTSSFIRRVGYDQYLLDGEKKGIDPLP